jgi:hypothetical protein
LERRPLDPPLRGFERTEGASPAFLRELLRRAALLAAEEDADVVEDRHTSAALEELRQGGDSLTGSLLGARPPTA